jgi:hypothetical protein
MSEGRMTQVEKRLTISLCVYLPALAMTYLRGQRVVLEKARGRCPYLYHVTRAQAPINVRSWWLRQPNYRTRECSVRTRHVYFLSPIMTTSSEGSLETTTPTRIGAGSFAIICSSPGRPVVFEVAHVVDHTVEVEREFDGLHTVYTQCNFESIFDIPRALAFYNPQTQNLRFFPLSPDKGRRREPRRPFSANFFANLPQRACYVMDRVAPLPRDIGTIVRSNFYPERAILSGAEVPLMCRLYFGKELRPSAFVNTNNFPIDVARYDLLQSKCQDDYLA